MRNYGAMTLAKLRNCVVELEAQSGDAYERVIAHDGDLQEHIDKARQVLSQQT